MPIPDVTATTAPHRARVVSLIVLLGASLLVVASGRGRAVVASILSVAEEVIQTHPVSGLFVFLALAVISAMFAFFSSAILLPAAIHVWGAPAAFGLLWLGWFVGGITAYTISRWLGRDVVALFLPLARLERYERRLSAEATWMHVFALHVMIPSEIPGYVLGLLRFPFLRYVSVLALVEIPFAAAAVFLGHTFVQGNVVLFAWLGAGAILLSLFTARMYLHHELQ